MRNLILGCVFVHVTLKYTYVCAHLYSGIYSGDNDDPDRILGGLVSDELAIVLMTESPQPPSFLSNLLVVLPAPTNDAGSMAVS